MRVGFGVTHLVRGLLTDHVDGIGIYTRHVLGEISRQAEVTAVQFGRCSELDSLRQQFSVPLECLPAGFQAGTAFSVLTGQSFPRSRALQQRLDLFHAPDHHIPRLTHVPVVATIMDAIPLAHPEWASARLRRIKNFAFRSMARTAQRIVTISEFSKSDIVHYFSIPPERIDVTYLGVNPAYAQPVTEAQRAAVLGKYGLAAGYFIFVGTIQPRKNVARILAAHRMLPAEMQKAFPLVIVGRNGWGTDELLPELEGLQQRGCGRWLSNVSDAELHALLQAARGLVYPSLYEGFGLPVLEGFAAGVPVISSTTTSIPEVAADVALLVDPLQTDAIAEAMRRLAENDVLAADLRERGRERVQQFTWTACAQQTMDVYRRVAG